MPEHAVLKRTVSPTSALDGYNMRYTTHHESCFFARFMSWRNLHYKHLNSTQLQCCYSLPPPDSNFFSCPCHDPEFSVRSSHLCGESSRYAPRPIGSSRCHPLPPPTTAAGRKRCKIQRTFARTVLLDAAKSLDTAQHSRPNFVSSKKSSQEFAYHSVIGSLLTLRLPD